MGGRKRNSLLLYARRYRARGHGSLSGLERLLYIPSGVRVYRTPATAMDKDGVDDGDTKRYGPPVNMQHASSSPTGVNTIRVSGTFQGKGVGMQTYIRAGRMAIIPRNPEVEMDGQKDQVGVMRQVGDDSNGSFWVKSAEQKDDARLRESADVPVTGSSKVGLVIGTGRIASDVPVTGSSKGGLVIGAGRNGGDVPVVGSPKGGLIIGAGPNVEDVPMFGSSKGGSVLDAGDNGGGGRVVGSSKGGLIALHCHRFVNDGVCAQPGCPYQHDVRAALNAQRSAELRGRS